MLLFICKIIYKITIIKLDRKLASLSRSYKHFSSPLQTHLRQVKVDGDLQVGLPVVAVAGGRSSCRLQLWREAGLQPLRARHHLHLLHALLAQAKHLTPEVLHLLVVYGVELMETWW